MSTSHSQQQKGISTFKTKIHYQNHTVWKRQVKLRKSEVDLQNNFKIIKIIIYRYHLSQFANSSVLVSALSEKQCSTR